MGGQALQDGREAQPREPHRLPHRFHFLFQGGRTFPGHSRKTSVLPKFSRTGLGTPYFPPRNLVVLHAAPRLGAGAGVERGGFWTSAPRNQTRGKWGPRPAGSLMWSPTSTILGALCPPIPLPSAVLGMLLSPTTPCKTAGGLGATDWQVQLARRTPTNLPLSCCRPSIQPHPLPCSGTNPPSLFHLRTFAHAIPSAWFPLCPQSHISCDFRTQLPPGCRLPHQPVNSTRALASG